MNISSYIVPFLVLIIVVYGIYKKTDVYDEFVIGSKDGLKTVINIFPYILGMVLSINIVINTGFLNFIFKFMYTFFDKIGIPSSIIPMAIMRPISGSSSLAILNNILLNNGPDSLIGRIASVLQGSTDTTLYVITLYFGSIGVKKIKYSLTIGLLTDLIGIVFSILVVKIMFFH